MTVRLSPALILLCAAALLASSPARAMLPPFMVFFNFGSARLGPKARAILDNLTATVSWAESAVIFADGHADRAVSDEVNRQLSCRRAEAVRYYLVSRGVPRERIVVQGYGERRPPVETPDGVAELSNRRVEMPFVAWPAGRAAPALAPASALLSAR